MVSYFLTISLLADIDTKSDLKVNSVSLEVLSSVMVPAG